MIEGPFVSLDQAALARTAADLEPDYLAPFSAIAAAALRPLPRCNVVVFGSWGGIELDFLSTAVPGATIRGFENSEAGSRGAVQRVSALNLGAAYEELMALPTSLPSSRFTHAISVHPSCRQAAFQPLLLEMVRLAAPTGQIIVALPMRGSFVEVFDLIREFGQKFDLPEVHEAADVAALARPNPEQLQTMATSAGLVDVEVDVEMLGIPFPSGREFVEHPLFDLVVGPDIRRNLDLDPTLARQVIAYVRDATLRYWSDGPFDLTVNVGCIVGKRA